MLSHFRLTIPAGLINHQQYARPHRYRFELINASALPQTLAPRAVDRHEVLLNTLRNAQAGQLVLLLATIHLRVR